MEKRVELLAPAGSYDSLRAAINAGCDAAYIGGSLYGARQFADNLNEEMMLEAIDYSHLHGKKLYMTVNTLLKEKELSGLYEYLLPYYRQGLDAVIVQDIGAMRLISKRFPLMQIHASTQTSIMMAEGAEYLRKTAGINTLTRLVPARELSLDEIKRMREATSLELEVFIHGALCYCYSGQCLMSSMIGGRSGNRGRCAQPCRRRYTIDGRTQYFLSPKDICTLELLPELIEAGICSFKIEGRMKSPEYTAGVVSVYRKYMDIYYKYGCEDYKAYIAANRGVFEADIDKLRELYNRGGFSDGYFDRHNGSVMMSNNRPNHTGIRIGEISRVYKGRVQIKAYRQLNPQDIIEIRDEGSIDDRDSHDSYEFTLGTGIAAKALFEANVKHGLKLSVGQSVYRTKNAELLRQIREKYVSQNVRIEIEGEFRAEAGKRAELRLVCRAQNQEVTVLSEDIIEKAENKPADEEKTEKQLSRFGETAFVMSSMSVKLSGDVFLPVSMLNDMRRTAVRELSRKICEAYGRNASEGDSDIAYVRDDLYAGNTENADRVAPGLTVTTADIGQLSALAGIQEVKELCYNIRNFEYGDIRSAVSICRGNNKRLFIGLPYICRAETYDCLAEYLIRLRTESVDGLMVRNYEELYLVEKENAERQSHGISLLDVRPDYNVYNMNRISISDRRRYTLPVELNKNELAPLMGRGSEMIVYGRQLLMISAQCRYKDRYGKCVVGNEGRKIVLTDEGGHSFPVRQICRFCYNLIYNSDCLWLINQKSTIEKLSPEWIRFDFLDETPEEAVRIVNSWIASIRRSDMENSANKYTGGHFNRGVD